MITSRLVPNCPVEIDKCLKTHGGLKGRAVAIGVEEKDAAGHIHKWAYVEVPNRKNFILIKERWLRRIE